MTIKYQNGMGIAAVVVLKSCQPHLSNTLLEAVFLDS